MPLIVSSLFHQSTAMGAWRHDWVATSQDTFSWHLADVVLPRKCTFALCGRVSLTELRANLITWYGRATLFNWNQRSVAWSPNCLMVCPCTVKLQQCSRTANMSICTTFPLKFTFAAKALLVSLGHFTFHFLCISFTMLITASSSSAFFTSLFLTRSILLKHIISKACSLYLLSCLEQWGRKCWTEDECRRKPKWESSMLCWYQHSAQSHHHIPYFHYLSLWGVLALWHAVDN